MLDDVAGYVGVYDEVLQTNALSPDRRCAERFEAIKANNLRLRKKWENQQPIRDSERKMEKQANGRGKQARREGG